MTNCLAEKFQAEIFGFEPDIFHNMREKILCLTPKFFKLGRYRIYSSFGVSSFINLQGYVKYKKQANLLGEKLLTKIKSKNDALNLEISGVRIGDLIYDGFLRRFDELTVDLTDDRYKNYLLDSIAIFLFWENYFESNNIRSIIISHCVYRNGIVLRLAISKNIPAYQVSLTHIYRLSSQNNFAYKDFDAYRALFKSIDQEKSSHVISESKKIIQNRIRGAAGVDQIQKKVLYHKGDLLLEGDTKEYNKKAQYIVVAAHVFSDSPHSFGDFLFADFFDWIDFINIKAGNDKKYIWVLKIHPDTSSIQYQKINKLAQRWGNLKILDPSITNSFLINRGVKALLTVHGSIALEYAMFDIPVIAASQNNLYRSYPFVKTAKTLKLYDQMLNDFDVLYTVNNKEDIYEFYFMNNHYKYNIFDDSYKKMLENIGGYYEQFNTSVYEYFISNFNISKHNKIKKNINRFLDSAEYRFLLSLDDE